MRLNGLGMLPIGNLPVDGLYQPLPCLLHRRPGKLGPGHSHMTAAAYRLHHQLHVEAAQ